MGPKPKAPPPPPAMDPKEFEIKMEIQMMKDHVLSVYAHFLKIYYLETKIWTTL